MSVYIFAVSVYVLVGLFVMRIQFTMMNVFNSEFKLWSMLWIIPLVTLGWPIYIALFPYMLSNAVGVLYTKYARELAYREATIKDLIDSNAEDLAAKQAEMNEAVRNLKRLDAWLCIKDYNLRFTEKMLKDFAELVGAPDLMQAPQDMMVDKYE